MIDASFSNNIHYVTRTIQTTKDLILSIEDDIQEVRTLIRHTTTDQDDRQQLIQLLQLENNNLKSQIDQQQVEIQSLQSFLSTLEEEKNQQELLHQEEIELFEQKLTNLQQENEDQNSKILIFESEIDRTIKQYHQAIAEKDDIFGKAKELDDYCNQIEAQVSEYHTQVINLQSEKDQSFQRYSILEQQLQSKQQELNQQSEQYQILQMDHQTVIKQKAKLEQTLQINRKEFEQQYQSLSQQFQQYQEQQQQEQQSINQRLNESYLQSQKEKEYFQFQQQLDQQKIQQLQQQYEQQERKYQQQLLFTEKKYEAEIQQLKKSQVPEIVNPPIEQKEAVQTLQSASISDNVASFAKTAGNTREQERSAQLSSQLDSSFEETLNELSPVQTQSASLRFSHESEKELIPATEKSPEERLLTSHGYDSYLLAPREDHTSRGNPFIQYDHYIESNRDNALKPAENVIEPEPWQGLAVNITGKKEENEDDEVDERVILSPHRAQRNSLSHEVNHLELVEEDEQEHIIHAVSSDEIVLKAREVYNTDRNLIHTNTSSFISLQSLPITPQRTFTNPFDEFDFIPSIQPDTKEDSPQNSKEHLDFNSQEEEEEDRDHLYANYSHLIEESEFDDFDEENIQLTDILNLKLV